MRSGYLDHGKGWFVTCLVITIFLGDYRNIFTLARLCLKSNTRPILKGRTMTLLTMPSTTSSQPNPSQPNSVLLFFNKPYHIALTHVKMNSMVTQHVALWTRVKRLWAGRFSRDIHRCLSARALNRAVFIRWPNLFMSSEP